MVDIRLCREDEIGDVMRFIDEYWGKGHILSVDKDFMDWQHKEKEYYNFVVAYVDGVLSGIYGFVPVSHFDKNVTRPWVVGAIWKVDPKTNAPMLGVRILEFIQKELGYKFIGIGINEAVSKLYPMLGFCVDKMSHYYIKNPKLDKCKIFVGRESKTLSNNACIVETTTPHINAKDWKTPEYLFSRYTSHPYYKYQFHKLIGKGSKELGMIVTRNVEYDSAKAIRIIDFVGDSNTLKYVGKSLLDLVQKENAEYIDIYSYGIPKDVFLEAGFLEVEEGDIVPLFFEPFVKENVDIKIAIPPEYKNNILLFPGYGDQDRPNIIHKREDM